MADQQALTNISAARKWLQEQAESLSGKAAVPYCCTYACHELQKNLHNGTCSTTNAPFPGKPVPSMLM